LTAEVVAAIQRQAANWRPAQGVCGRCLELYRLKPLAQPATLFV
jgi:hypothetical protein